MPITRTPIIDDDGTGTTGTVFENAWKQELYNQIDAALGAIGGVPTVFLFTDTSGAGIVFPAAYGLYVKFGRLVVFSAQVVFPATAASQPVTLSGLPFPVSDIAGGAFQGFGAPPFMGWANVGGSTIQFLNPTTGLNLTYAAFSGANVLLHGFYFSAT